jgi:hypothetical protein
LLHPFDVPGVRESTIEDIVPMSGAVSTSCRNAWMGVQRDRRRGMFESMRGMSARARREGIIPADLQNDEAGARHEKCGHRWVRIEPLTGSEPDVGSFHVDDAVQCAFAAYEPKEFDLAFSPMDAVAIEGRVRVVRQIVNFDEIDEGLLDAFDEVDRVMREAPGCNTDDVWLEGQRRRFVSRRAIGELSDSDDSTRSMDRLETLVSDKDLHGSRVI